MRVRLRWVSYMLSCWDRARMMTGDVEARPPPTAKAPMPRNFRANELMRITIEQVRKFNHRSTHPTFWTHIWHLGSFTRKAPLTFTRQAPGSNFHPAAPGANSHRVHPVRAFGFLPYDISRTEGSHVACTIPAALRWGRPPGGGVWVPCLWPGGIPLR